MPTQAEPEHLLDQDIPRVTKRLRALPPSAQEQLVVRLALYAGKIGLFTADARTVLSELGSQRELEASEAKSALASSEALDKRYLAMLNAGSTITDLGIFFFSARLLRGIAVAFGASTSEDIADAVYEITRSVEDTTTLLPFVISEIDQIEKCLREARSG